MDSAGWHTVRANDTRREVLLYRLAPDGLGGYTAQITDTVDVWTEILSKTQVIDRARKSSCSVDPSQGESQLRVFFSLLHDAFAAKDGTTLSIDDYSSDTRVAVYPKCEMPKPLGLFKWSLQLNLEERSRLRDDLWIPITRKVSENEQLISRMTAALAEKDDAISKILDKIDRAGIDIGSVFPAAASAVKGQKATGAALAQHVRGLKRFNLEDCRSTLQAQESQPSMDQLFTAVLESPLPLSQPAQSTASSDSLPRKSINGHSLSQDKHASLPYHPESPVSRKRAPSVASSGSESTEDEDDPGEVQSPQQKNNDARTMDISPAKYQADGLPHRQDQHSPGDRHDLKLENTATNPAALKSPSKPPREVSVDRSPAKVKPKLGAVGGKKARDPPANQQATGKSLTEAESPQKTSTTAPQQGSPLRSHAPASPEAPAEDAPRNDAQAADARREQLKRQLANQGKTQPKKRKF